ncbi:MAG: PKD domain-containing protein, partial [Candidatus Thermoplasmatota archaeon]
MKILPIFLFFIILTIPISIADNYVIDKETLFENETKEIYGNIIVLSNLTLKNTTLKIIGGNIIVNGSLYVLNGSLITGSCFLLFIDKNAKYIVENSEVHAWKNLEIKENDFVTYTVKVSLPIEELTYEWYVNNSLVSTAKHEFVFKTNYSSSGNYIIKAVVKNEKKTWTYCGFLSVKDSNRAPKIVDYEPKEIKNLGEEVNFFANAEDEDGDEIIYEWYIDGEKVSTSAHYTFKPKKTKLYKVEVIVSDGKNSTKQVWEFEYTVKMKEEEKNYLPYIIPIIIIIPSISWFAYVKYNSFSNAYKKLKSLSEIGGDEKEVIKVLDKYSSLNKYSKSLDSKLYSLLIPFFPLYSKIRKEEILDNDMRARIYAHISENPGVHYSSILKSFGITPGNLTYHLITLERNEYIKWVIDGRLKCYYPIEYKVE